MKKWKPTIVFLILTIAVEAQQEIVNGEISKDYMRTAMKTFLQQYSKGFGS